MQSNDTDTYAARLRTYVRYQSRIYLFALCVSIYRNTLHQLFTSIELTLWLIWKCNLYIVDLLSIGIISSTAHWTLMDSDAKTENLYRTFCAFIFQSFHLSFSFSLSVHFCVMIRYSGYNISYERKTHFTVNLCVIHMAYHLLSI